METKKLNRAIRLIEILLDINQEYVPSLSKGDIDYYSRRKELKDCIECLYDLLAEKYQWEMGELVEIENGEAHVLGYWADNQNDYGPHPYRYTEISGFFMNYKELAKFIRNDGNLADLESEYTQYPQDGEDVTDESAWREYLDDRRYFRTVTYKRFYSGRLPDGQYFVKLGE